jgi:hypothetical protein
MRSVVAFAISSLVVVATAPRPAIAQTCADSPSRLTSTCADVGAPSSAPARNLRRQRDGIGDGILKGALIGAVVGAVVGAIGAADSDSRSCSPGSLFCGDPLVSDTMVFFGMTALGAGIGAGIGAVADALHDVSPARTTGGRVVRVVPRVSSRQAGAGIIVRW